MRNSVWRPAPGEFLRGTAIFLSLAGLLLSTEVRAENAIATLWLDSDSYISYSDSEKAKIPDGSSIRFRLGLPASDGSIPITVNPGDVAIAPIPVAEGAAIEYSLADPAIGSLRAGSLGYEIELVATLVATLRGRPEVPPASYALRFTTDRTHAQSGDRRDSVEVEGAPVNSSNKVTLVGAATNRSDAYPGAGQAAYAVLSGTLDQLPETR